MDRGWSRGLDLGFIEERDPKCLCPPVCWRKLLSCSGSHPAEVKAYHYGRVGQDLASG